MVIVATPETQHFVLMTNQVQRPQQLSQLLQF